MTDTGRSEDKSELSLRAGGARVVGDELGEARLLKEGPHLEL